MTGPLSGPTSTPCPRCGAGLNLKARRLGLPGEATFLGLVWECPAAPCRYRGHEAPTLAEAADVVRLRLAGVSPPDLLVTSQV